MRRTFRLISWMISKSKSSLCIAVAVEKTSKKDKILSYAGLLSDLTEEEGKLIEDADILIASIAIVEGSVLIADNVKHFKRIKGLETKNWKERRNLIN